MILFDPGVNFFRDEGEVVGEVIDKDLRFKELMSIDLSWTRDRKSRGKSGDRTQGRQAKRTGSDGSSRVEGF